MTDFVTRHRAVLTRFVGLDHSAAFGYTDEDTGEQTVYFLPSESLWREMGSPDTLTISVVPGDKLNEEQGRV